MYNHPIGIFDSGVGGLTVLNQLTKALPQESFIYYGDSGRAPYGSRTKEELTQFNNEIIQFLIGQPVKAIVMACNTSCALVLTDLEKSYSIPMVGLITPAVQKAVTETKNKKIAILATEQTVRSGAYKNSILNLDPSITVAQIPCPRLVPIVENGEISSAAAKQTALNYFQQVQESQADTIVYGCSHYPYFESIFKSVPSQVEYFIDPAQTMVDSVQKALGKANLFADKNQKGEIQYWVSGDTKKFQNFLKLYFNISDPKIRSHQFATKQ